MDLAACRTWTRRWPGSPRSAAGSPAAWFRGHGAAARPPPIARERAGDGARPLRVKLILPALTEATSPYWRPIKYSLFPPLGLATIAAYLGPDDHAEIVDEHVAPLSIDDEPDLVLIQVYRLFQGAATVDSILRGDLIERAAEAGLRSIFVGFETLTPDNLRRSNKLQNLGRDYKAVTERLHGLGIMINGSFVFGMDDDDADVFARTVDWAIEHGLTTATFHIQTPYPGTRLFARMQDEGRITTRNWDRYDTRHVVYRPAQLQPDVLKDGYDWAYREFYRWPSIARASLSHGSHKHQAKHFFYATGWKKFEPLWNLVIQARQLSRMTPLLEAVLSKVSGDSRHTGMDQPDAAARSPEGPSRARADRAVPDAGDP
jgi:hypothetical protein